MTVVISASDFKLLNFYKNSSRTVSGRGELENLNPNKENSFFIEGAADILSSKMKMKETKKYENDTEHIVRL